MQFLGIFLLALSTTGAVHRFTDSNDPVPEHNEAEMWTVLYSKLNRLLDETIMLKETIMDIKQRQDHQGHEIAELLERSKTDKKCTAVKSLNIRSSHNKRDWTVILRREDGSVDFQRNWTDYKRGFGNPNGEFFIGLDKLYKLTTYEGPQELLITLGDWDNERRYAKYDHFQIGNEAEQYAIKELGTYSGDAGDALFYHKGMKFSTLDNSNSGHCPRNYGGGWWFNDCEDSNLNSVYRHQGEISDMRKILWSTWKGWTYSLKFAEMKIRSTL